MDSGARSTSRPDATRGSGVRRPVGPIDPRTEAQPSVAEPAPEVARSGPTDGKRRSGRNARSPGRGAPRGAGVLEHPSGTPATGAEDTQEADGPEGIQVSRRPSKRWATLTKLLLGPEAPPNGDPTPPHDPAQQTPTAPPPAVAAQPPSGTSGSVLLPPIRTSPPAEPDRPAENGRAPAPAEVRTVPATPSPAPPSGPSPTGEPTQLQPATVDPSGPILTTRVLVPPPGTQPQPAGEPPQLERRATRASVTFQRRSTRPRVRRVTRVLRHVDTWSVFKVALVFSVFLYAVALTAGVLLWHVAMATGTIDNVERFFEGFGWESFQFKGGEIYHSAWIGGMFAAVGLTGLAVLLATLFNLITDLVGGVRVSVLEEEVLARRDRTPAVVLEHEPDEGTLYDQARHG